MTLLTFPEDKECSWVAYRCRDPQAQPSHFHREHPEDAGSSAKLSFILEYLNTARTLLVMLLTSLLMGNGCLNSPHPGSTEQQLINADKTTSSQPSYYWEVKMAATVTEGHEATFPWKVTSPLIRVWRHITAASDPETVPSSQSLFPGVLKPRSWSQSCRVSKTQIVAGMCGVMVSAHIFPTLSIIPQIESLLQPPSVSTLPIYFALAQAVLIHNGWKKMIFWNVPKWNEERLLTRMIKFKLHN